MACDPWNVPAHWCSSTETPARYCATGSLRRAADLLHLHHSSVSRRLDQIGRTLGIGLTEPTGPMRARLALTTWRLLND